MGTGTSAQAVQGFAMAIGAHTQVWGCRHECTGVCVDVCIRARYGGRCAWVTSCV